MVTVDTHRQVIAHYQQFISIFNELKVEATEAEDVLAIESNIAVNRPGFPGGSFP